MITFEFLFQFLGVTKVVNHFGHSDHFFFDQVFVLTKNHQTATDSNNKSFVFCRVKIDEK